MADSLTHVLLPCAPRDYAMFLLLPAFAVRNSKQAKHASATTIYLLTFGCWAANRSFDTKAGEWQDIHLPFKDFVPLFRAKKVKEATLDPSTVTSIQVRSC